MLNKHGIFGNKGQRSSNVSLVGSLQHTHVPTTADVESTALVVSPDAYFA